MLTGTFLADAAAEPGRRRRPELLAGSAPEGAGPGETGGGEGEDSAASGKNRFRNICVPIRYRDSSHDHEPRPSTDDADAQPASERPSRPAREAVPPPQRARMIDAMAAVVADKGYAATTVADVVERAGVSRPHVLRAVRRPRRPASSRAYDVGLAVRPATDRGAVEGEAGRGAGGWRDSGPGRGRGLPRPSSASEPAFAGAPSGRDPHRRPRGASTAGPGCC